MVPGTLAFCPKGPRASAEDLQIPSGAADRKRPPGEEKEVAPRTLPSSICLAATNDQGLVPNVMDASEHALAAHFYALLHDGAAAPREAGPPRATAERGRRGGAVGGGRTARRPPLFDVDANLTHEALQPDLEGHVECMKRVGVVGCICPGSNVDDSVAALKLGRLKPGFIFATAGVHPYHAGGLGRSLTEVEKDLRCLCSEAGCVAVGECGLDATEGFPSLEEQLPVLQMQLRIARDLAKPLFLHVRGAHEEFLRLLQRAADEAGPVVARHPPLGVPMLVHCFTGSTSELADVVALGCYISVSGFICKEKAGAELRGALASGAVPLGRIMVETDAPYMGFKGCRLDSPAPDRKKTFPNPPSSLPIVVDKLAECLALPTELVAMETARNARRFFGISV